MELERCDSQAQSDTAPSQLRQATDDGATFVLRGNSCAIAAALIEAIDTGNERDPNRRVILLNDAAVDPA